MNLIRKNQRFATLSILLISNISHSMDKFDAMDTRRAEFNRRAQTKPWQEWFEDEKYIKLHIDANRLSEIVFTINGEELVKQITNRKKLTRNCIHAIHLLFDM